MRLKESIEMKHGNFALFIPLQGCPNHCIYCDQNKISGQEKMSPQIAGDILHRELPRWKQKNISGQIAFFGGTFTGLPQEVMEAYLDIAFPYVQNGTVSGIRISTRPDYIDKSTLELLKQKGVTHIELGVQSMNDEVLRRSGRGYEATVVRESAKMIRSFGFVLGMQMMPGLPGDTPQRSIYTAEQIIDLGAEETRIYPTVVLRGTPLETIYMDGKYQPMGLEQAVDLSARLKRLFTENNVTVLKVGLHSGAVEQEIVAGPFHPSFGQLVDSRLCLNDMLSYCEREDLKDTNLYVVSRRFDVSDIIGQHRSNAAILEERFAVHLKISKKVLTIERHSIIL